MVETVQLHHGMMLYALDKDEKIVHVDSVANGLECNCTCPACHGKLIAKNGGEIYRHHFAHDGGQECQYGVETSLHFLAKEIISRGIPVRFPASYFRFTTCWNHMLWRREFRGPYKGMAKVVLKSANNRYRITEKTSIKPDSVKLEHRIGGVIPDIVLECKGRPLIVEIFVSHAVDEEKKKKLKFLGIPAIEINLSEIDRDVDEAFLEEALEDGRFTNWIYAPKRDALEDNYIELLKVPKSPGQKEYSQYDLECMEYEIRGNRVENPPCAEHSKFETGATDGTRLMSPKWCRNCPFCLNINKERVLCCRHSYEYDVDKDLYHALGLYRYQKFGITAYDDISECHVNDETIKWDGLIFNNPFKKNGKRALSWNSTI